jgi:hypothetical protein
MTSPRGQRASIWAIRLIVAFYVLAVFLHPDPWHNGINKYKHAYFDEMVAGTASKPFVYRALFPTTIRVVSKLTPEGGRQDLARRIKGSQTLSGMFQSLGWQWQYAHEYLVAAGIMYVCFVLFAYFVGRFVLESVDITRSAFNISLTESISLLGLIPFFRYNSFIYDPPQLFLFTMCLYLLWRQKWRAYIPVFVLACLNKETAVLLPLVFGVHYARRLNRGRYMALVLAQVTIFAVVKTGLTYLFRANPGPFVPFHLLDHGIGTLLQTYRFTAFLALLLGGLLVFYGWKRKPAFLRTGFVWTLGPLLALGFILGYWDEWRGYYEAYPLALALSAWTLKSLKGALPTEN